MNPRRTYEERPADEVICPSLLRIPRAVSEVSQRKHGYLQDGVRTNLETREWIGYKRYGVSLIQMEEDAAAKRKAEETQTYREIRRRTQLLHPSPQSRLSTIQHPIVLPKLPCQRRRAFRGVCFRQIDWYWRRFRRGRGEGIAFDCLDIGYGESASEGLDMSSG